MFRSTTSQKLGNFGFFTKCQHCNSKPATIRCMYQNKNIQELCYACESKINQQSKSLVKKEVIPYNEMLSSRSYLSPSHSNTQSKDYEKDYSKSQMQSPKNQELISKLSSQKNYDHEQKNGADPQDIAVLKKQIQALKEKQILTEQQYQELLGQEQEKTQILTQQLEQISNEYDSQVQELRGSLLEIRGQYENKLKEFEVLLIKSSDTIKYMQTQLSKNQQTPSTPSDTMAQELKKALDQRTNEIKELEQAFHQTKSFYEAKEQQIEKIISSKDQIITELTKNAEMRELEMQKMEEITSNFKELFEYYNQEKALLTQENKSLNEELATTRQYMRAVIDQAEEEKNDQQDDEQDQQKKDDKNDSEQEVNQEEVEEDTENFDLENFDEQELSYILARSQNITKKEELIKLMKEAKELKNGKH